MAQSRRRARPPDRHASRLGPLRRLRHGHLARRARAGVPGQAGARAGRGGGGRAGRRRGRRAHGSAHRGCAGRRRPRRGVRATEPSPRLVSGCGGRRGIEPATRSSRSETRSSTPATSSSMPLHVEHPEWDTAFDADPELGLQTRLALLAGLADSGRDRCVATWAPSRAGSSARATASAGAVSEVSPVARTRRRSESLGRRLRCWLGSGCSAAPGGHSLALLPSGPDAVRRLPVRGT